MRMLGALAVVWAVLALAGAGSLRAQAPVDPAALAASLNDAINAGDLDAAVALFHPDAVYETPSCPAGACIGTAAIREILSTFIADELRITALSPFEVDGAEVRGRSASESVGLRAAGVDRIIVVVIGTVRDARFERWQVIPDLTDPATAALFAPGMPAAGGGGLADWRDRSSGRPALLAAISIAGALLAIVAFSKRRSF